MDRKVSIFKPSGHKVAEIEFSYDEKRWARARVSEFRQLYDDNDPADEDKSVYESDNYEEQVQYQQLDSIDKVKAFDRDYAQKKLRQTISGPIDKCRFEYEEHPVLVRYFLTNNRGVVGVVDIVFSFIGDTKQVAFRSGKQLKFDMDITTDSLETNLSCLSRLMIYDDPVLQGCDVHKVDKW